jgi:AraC-like DNA-binding protein
MNFILLENVSLCAGVLGLFLVIPLIAMRRRRPANLWLALYALTIACASLEDYLHYQQLPWIDGMYWPNICVDAFYYCYVRSLTGLGNGRFQSIHFAPTGLYLTAALLSLAPGSPLAPAFALWEHGTWSATLYQVLGAFYLVAVLYRLRQYRQRVRRSGVPAGQDDLRWLTTLSYVLAVLWFSWVLAVRLHGNWTTWFVVGRLATFYFVGWYGLRQSAVFVPAMAEATGGALPHAQPPAPLGGGANQVTAEPPPVPANAARAAAPASPNTPLVPEAVSRETAEREKYARSGMTDAAQNLIGERLQRRMAQQRDYLESDLRLTELAERIGTTPQLLSQYLNHTLGLSFFDYINGLRIAEVQKMMRAPAYAGHTLLELAHAAGFNSKSTFNAAFKNASGMAPSQWRAHFAQAAGSEAAHAAHEAAPEPAAG